ncbi:MAG: BNR-4 repeat-containing protein [bacterium]|nr:MAG: BNR-4 repeat-containing protein [bacterium]
MGNFLGRIIVLGVLLVVPVPSDGPESPNKDLDAINEMIVNPVHPYSSFLSGCPKIGHHGNTSYIIYASPNYDLFVRGYDHRHNLFLMPQTIGRGFNDHIYPAILGDEHDRFHITFGSRPDPVSYLAIEPPFRIDPWQSIEKIGESGTYPVPVLFDGKIFLTYREGDATRGSLVLACKELDAGAYGWRLITLVTESDDFVPMPLDAMATKDGAIFLFNMRDAALSYPEMDVQPSVREALSALRTKDGVEFTDIAGNTIDVPLDYTNDRKRFPLIVSPQYRLHLSKRIHEGQSVPVEIIRYDGSYVECAFAYGDASRLSLRMEDGTDTLFELGLTPRLVTASNGAATDSVSLEDSSETCIVKTKLYFSCGLYRLWINGRLRGGPRRFGRVEEGSGGVTKRSDMKLVTSADSRVYIDMRTGRERKISTASACIDHEGVPNIFFIERRDTAEKSYWALMHLRRGALNEIGDPSYHKFHSSCAILDTYLYVAASYFTGSGLFTQNEHLSTQSEITLLRTRDYVHWSEVRITNNDLVDIHPYLAGNEPQSRIELLWTRPTAGRIAHLYFATFNPGDVQFTDIPTPTKKP